MKPRRAFFKVLSPVRPIALGKLSKTYKMCDFFIRIGGSEPELGWSKVRQSPPPIYTRRVIPQRERLVVKPPVLPFLSHFLYPRY